MTLPSECEHSDEGRPALYDFLREHNGVISAIDQAMRRRDFDKVERSAISYLKLSCRQFDEFEEPTTSLINKVQFLRSVAAAWEIADSTNRFNKGTLGKGYAIIRSFSDRCVKNLRAAGNAPAMTPDEKKYWTKVAQCGLISIVENYRLQELTRCREQLLSILGCAKALLKVDAEDDTYNLVGQIFYYLSKTERYEGNLQAAESHLRRSIESYHKLANRLNAQTTSSVENYVDTEERLNETMFRIGVIEVTRAWLFFAQCAYGAARHSAHNALLLLIRSADELSKVHARLVLASASRVTAKSPDELDRIITELIRIREHFSEIGHLRLQARTEYELLQALLLQDSFLTKGLVPNLRNEKPLESANYYLNRQLSTQHTRRWEALKLVLRSRVLRRLEINKIAKERNFDAAIKAAALANARSPDNPNCQVESLIAWGQAYLHQGIALRNAQGLLQPEKRGSRRHGVQDGRLSPEMTEVALDSFSEAREKFKSALDLCLEHNFPESRAITCLLLARAAVWSGALSEVEYYFQEFRLLRPGEHAGIRQLHEKVLAEYQEGNYVLINDDELTKEHSFRKLKKFLLKKAKQKAKASKGERATDTDYAKAIGISRTTFYSWEKEIRKNEGSR